MTIKIVTDSACDVPTEMAKAHGIRIVPIFLNIGDDSYRDGVDLSRQTFYERWPTLAAHPTTAAPSAGMFANAYRQLVAEGATQIVSLHVAASLSATLQAAQLGAKEVSVPVTHIDTNQISVAAGQLVLFAARAAQNGRSLNEIIELVEQAKPQARIFGMIDTLDALRRSGRVNWAQFGFGTLLKIKPIMMIAQGEINVIGRVRTRGRAIEHLQTVVQSLAPFADIALIHVHALAAAQELQAESQALFGAENLPIIEIGPAVGVHLGIGSIGFACIAKS